MTNFRKRDKRERTSLVASNTVADVYGKIGKLCNIALRLRGMPLAIALTATLAINVSGDNLISVANAGPQAVSKPVLSKPTLILSATKRQQAVVGELLRPTAGGALQAIVGVPLDNILVHLKNPGQETDNARLRIFVHSEDDREVGADDIKIAVLEAGTWKALNEVNVAVEPIDGGVMGAIGGTGLGKGVGKKDTGANTAAGSGIGAEAETGAEIDAGIEAAKGAGAGKSYKGNHQRGGFAIGKNANIQWRLQLTFAVAGRYSVVMAVSPDNGSTHLAQPISFNVEAS
ncbi:hypothetical protein [Crenothrix polyspora]|uniref:Uncharacterized protein n=1 Tax=Crenothrix polyspora TaxID=360316 RepID=A0A1R4H2Z1_9GAMM|nr:hypothetical protein [Crenothrix polyspora]SJM90219.1 hypothetical protein CRENPOLYSF1_1390014 [Crenothrix polyspora]